MRVDLTDDEFDTLKDIFNEHGSDCPSVDCDKMQALAEKMGIWEPKPPLTEEELRRREELRKGPLADFAKMLFRPNMLWQDGLWFNKVFSEDVSNAKIGSQLRVRLPQDYAVK